MEQSTIWRVGTDVTVTAVAVIEAVNEALKGAPQITGNPPVQTVNHLNYLPIALLSLLAVAWIVRLLFFRPKLPPNFVESPLEKFNGFLRWKEGRLKPVAGKQFKNAKSRSTVSNTSTVYSMVSRLFTTGLEKPLFLANQSSRLDQMERRISSSKLRTHLLAPYV